MNRRLKNAVFGLIGGAVGTFVIDQAIAGLKKFQSSEDKNLEKRLTPKQPTDALAERIVGEDKEDLVSQAIHWGYGIFWGGVYGVLRDEYPTVAKAFGLPFAAAFTAFGEGLLLPSAGLSAPAHKYPASTLMRDVTAHWAYTATTEGMCLLLDKADRALAAPPKRTNTELRRVS
jgi:uncharacterized membrane protein YagU involved in acid resistance